MLGFLFHILWRKVRDAFCGYGMASRWQRYPLYEHIPLLCQKIKAIAVKNNVQKFEDIEKPKMDIGFNSEFQAITDVKWEA